MITLADWQREMADARGRAEGDRALRREGEWVDFCAALAGCAALSETVCRQQASKHLLDDWTQTQRSLMSASLQEQIGHMRLKLTQSVSNALVDLLSEGIRRKAVDDFCIALKELSGDEPREGLAIRVPQNLQAATEQRLLAHGMSARVFPDDTAEISTQISGTRIKTSIASWTQDLLGAVMHVQG